MRNKLNRSYPHDKLTEVVVKLKQAQREIERLQYTPNGVSEVVSLSEGELLEVARSLLFLWNSRRSFLDATLIADPGWLILLNLKIAELTHDKTQISTMCIDSGAPATTALRWINLLKSKSLVKIERDTHDNRRKFVLLTDNGSELMGRYLQNIRNFIDTRGFIF